MFEAELYSIIYATIISILAYSVSIKSFLGIGRTEYYGSNDIKLVIFLVLIALFIGTRPVSDVWIDMPRYYWHFYDYLYYWENGNLLDNLAHPTELGFQLLAIISGYISDDAIVYFTVISFGYVFFPYFALKNFQVNETFVGMLFLMSTMSYLNMGTNVLRHGYAAALTILAFSFLVKDKRSQKYGCLCCLGAVVTHTSMLLPIALFFLIRRFDVSLNKIITFWLICIPISFAIGNTLANYMNMFEFIADRFEGYITEDTEYKIGFRWDFLIYSAIPICSSLYIIKRYQIRDWICLLITKTYIAANAFWILVIRMQYTDRMAYLSWFMYGLLLFYPTTFIPSESEKRKWVGFLLGIEISIKLILMIK